MPLLRPWSRLASALAACLLLVGCAANAQDAAQGSAGQDVVAQPDQQVAAGQPGGRDPLRQAGGAPGSPVGQGGGGEALGAPITIPRITIAEGRPIDEVRAEIEQAIRDKCGGTLCLTLRVEPRDPNHTTCEFSTTDPAPGSQVPRRSTVVIVSGTQPCTGDETAGEGTTTGSTQQPADQGTTGSDQQPADEGTTGSSQAPPTGTP